MSLFLFTNPTRKCAACKTAAANPYRDLCQSCYDAWRAAGSSICPSCKTSPSNRPHDLCGPCYDAWKRATLGERMQQPQPDPGKELVPGQNSTMWADFSVAEECTDDCAICLTPLKGELPAVKLSSCTHIFHRECIEKCVKMGALRCPLCGVTSGTIQGSQPPGIMRIAIRPDSLPGYEGSGTFIILYEIPPGIQGKDHPHPGSPYFGDRRIAFVPATEEGKKVVELLKVAFQRRLIFSIGTSATTGREDVVVWSSIHHKTQPTGGPDVHGYPDPTYLTRVQEELAAVGVK